MSEKKFSYALLRLTTEAAAVELTEQAMLDAGALSCSFTDAADHPLLEPAPGEAPLWPEIEVTGMFSEDAQLPAVVETLKVLLADYQLGDIAIKPLADQQWERVWMKDFEPIEISELFWVVPSFAQPPNPTAVNLIIDPGLAFGSGTHATTLLCLQWLSMQSLEGKIIVDYGCGSGILAIAAALLGAKTVYALDIDPQACESTVVNARRNGVADVIRVISQDGQIESEADLLVANILLTPLLERCSLFNSLLGAGGQLALSGVLQEQQEQLTAAYDQTFENSYQNVLQEWMLYGASKRIDA